MRSADDRFSSSVFRRDPALNVGHFCQPATDRCVAALVGQAVPPVWQVEDLPEPATQPVRPQPVRSNCYVAALVAQAVPPVWQVADLPGPAPQPVPPHSAGSQICDVAIAGGGPGGCATALSLRSHAPPLSVALFEKSQYDARRPGEVLPGLARNLLDHLGVWTAFEAKRYRPVFATAVSWGGAALRENHSIYSARGHGWHLDRSAFDALLADQARERGVNVYAGRTLTAIQPQGSGWRLSLSDGTTLDARFVVDATGRSASLSRKLGARLLAPDGLVGFARYFRVPDGSDPRTVVEGSPEGWWYAAALGGDSLAIVAMTDLDIARQLQLERENVWHEMLARTQWVRSLVPAGATAHRAMARAAGSARLEPVCGDTWIAVGDAASAYDPLSSQGIVKALRSGIFASYAIAERLQSGSHTGLDRYRQFVQESFQAYEQAHGKFYAMEQRWADQPFWMRRQRRPYHPAS